MNKIEEAHPRVPDSVVIGQLRQTVDEKNALLDQNLALLHQKDAQLRDSQKQLRKKDAQLQKLQKEMEEIHVKNLKCPKAVFLRQSGSGFSTLLASQRHNFRTKIQLN
jgi:hypothetical protein